MSCHPPVLCCRYPREAVWAANLTLVAQLVKVWGQALVVDKMPLLKMLTQGDQRSASYLSAADRNVATALCSFAAFEVCAAATSSLSRPVEFPLSAPYSVLETRNSCTPLSTLLSRAISSQGFPSVTSLVHLPPIVFPVSICRRVP